MTRIYTRAGDGGTTGLVGGKRVSKDCLRVEAYGTVDELNAIFGVVRSHKLPKRIEAILLRVQNELFIIGANLAWPGEDEKEKWGIPTLQDESVRELERAIDDAEADLKPLAKFIVPGGPAPGAFLHLARTVARRTERRCVALARAERVDPAIIRYLNRLSDLCFVLARHVNHLDSRQEKHPSICNP